MEFIDQLWYTLSHFNFHGDWWQYLLALITVTMTTFGIVDYLRDRISAHFLSVVVALICLISAWSMVELIEMGLGLRSAFALTAIFCGILCGPMLYTISLIKRNRNNQ